MTSMTEGGCACGACRYELHGTPMIVHACHCTDCQQFSGSVFAAALIFRKEFFRLLSGTPRKFAVTAESGYKNEREF